MSAGDKIASKTAQSILHYFKNTLGINEEVRNHIQGIINALGEGMNEQEKALFKSLEGALTTAATADEWLKDPNLKAEILLLLEKLNRFPDDSEHPEMLQFAKEVLKSARDALTRNDGELMLDLSSALKTVENFDDLLRIIREYLTPSSVAYFGIASPIAAGILTHITHYSVSTLNDTTALRVREELNLLRTRLLLAFDQGRVARGLFLQGNIQIQILEHIRRAIAPNNPLPLQLQLAETLNQVEHDAQRYLDTITPFPPELLNLIQTHHLRLERTLRAEKSLLAFNHADLLDGVSCFTQGDMVIESLYENNLTLHVIPSASLTWGSIKRTYEQGGKLVAVQHQFVNEINESIGKLFDAITKKYVDTQLSLCQILTFVYSNELDEHLQNFQLCHPAVASELGAFHHHYHQVLNAVHVRNLLRAAAYTRLKEDNALYDILTSLLRKRAFFEVSHQLFCSLRFPYNIVREVKIGLLDACSTFSHPVDTLIDLATVPYRLFRHPIETPRQIGHFLWHRPLRVLSSAAASSAAFAGIGGIGVAAYKLSTVTNVASNVETLSRSNAMIHGGASKALTGGAAIVKSSASSALLAKSAAATRVTMTGFSLNKANEVSTGLLNNRRAQIAFIFQDIDQRLLEMNAHTFFKTIDQGIMDEENETNVAVEYRKF